jgi:predicted hotdog family 3-hydroxylacyl-ACP dehydratase
VLAADEAGIVCSSVIPGSHPLASAGEAPGFMAIELAAQAAAAHETLLRRRQVEEMAGARLGYLVSVRETKLPPTLPAGHTLRVIAMRSAGAGALTSYAMEVLDEAGSGVERVAAGALSTFLPDS